MIEQFSVGWCLYEAGPKRTIGTLIPVAPNLGLCPQNNEILEIFKYPSLDETQSFVSLPFGIEVPGIFHEEDINDSCVHIYNVIPSRYTSRVMGLGAVQRQSLITLA
ncbi:MAG: hypothetical protein QMD46_13810, partial [Methanomicrobiales archaeon]|nr:hypothetical protein [Methanomicrobiales archaeon]